MSLGERWLVATTEYAGLTRYTGGIGRHYAALLPALADTVAVDLVVIGDGPPLPRPDLGRVRLIRYARGDLLPQRCIETSCAQIVHAVFRRRRYDRVFAPEWGALAASLPRSAPLLTNLATSARLAHEIAQLRVSDLPRERRAAVRRQMRGETRQIRRSAGLISISRAMLERTAASLGALPPAAVVPNCIDVAHVRRAAVSAGRPPGWPEEGGPVLLFLGRSERRKGVHDAVAAFARLAAAHPRARLVLAGAGGDARFEPTRDELRRVLPPDQRGRLVWLGHVAGDELYAAVHAADLVLCPSRWEGFGQAALEAKAIGTPLVATSGSGFDDFCSDGLDCLLVPPGDPARLALAIDRVLAHPGEAADRAERARRQVDAFAPAPVAALLHEAADRLLGSVDAADRRSSTRRHPSPSRRTAPASAKRSSHPVIGHRPHLLANSAPLRRMSSRWRQGGDSTS